MSAQPALKVVRSKPTSDFLPHDEASEQALLAAIMRDERGLDLVADIVSKEDFYDPARGVIFDAMVQLHRSGDAISRASIVTWLTDRGLLAHAGGAANVARIDIEAPVLGKVASYARKISLKAQRRALILEMEQRAAEGRGDVGDEEEWLDSTTKSLRKHAKVNTLSNAVSLRQSLDVFFAQLNRVATIRAGVSGHSTGLRELDRLTAGWHGGHVTLISGETSAGKSAFAICQAQTVANTHQIETVEFDGQKVDVRVPIGVAIFTLEMEHDQVTQRLCCASARVNWLLVQNGDMDPYTMQALASASERLSMLPIYIDDDHDLTMTSFESRLARIEDVFAQLGVRLGLVILDYFQLLDVRGEGDKNANSEQRFNAAARRLKNFASRFRARPKALPIINGRVVNAGYLEPSRVSFGVLVQLNKGGDVRDCGAIEMHAHNHWTLETITDEPEGPGETTRAKIRLKKQRGGKKNSVAHCFRHAAYTLYSDDDR